MTTQNPLDILRSFSPRAADITGQATAGSNLATARMNRDLLGSQIQNAESQKIAQQEALASQTNIQNTAANLTRLNTALDQGATAEQVGSLLQQNILRAQQTGGTGADSQEALQTLQTGGLDAVRNLAGQATAVFQQQGVLKAPPASKDTSFTLGKGQQRFDAQGKLIASAASSSADGAEIGTDQAAFESLTKGLSDEQKEEAVLIKLGISPRAVSSADITIAESSALTEQIANSKAIIGERKKFGELTGSSRSRAIDNGFERIVKIDAAVGNIDRAIEVLNSGAGVGAIEKFLPSFKAASVELDNIQKSMALDVIGAVTFGALSQGELNLAKDVALPTGLNSKQLIEHLQARKTAQEKLRAYFNEQIQFLDQGGTIAGFLRKKETGSDVGALSDDELFN